MVPAGSKRRKGPGARECGRLPEAGKGKETSSSRPSRRNTALFALILAKRGSLQTADGQNCKIINGCCFKPLRLRSFVGAAMGDEFTR